MGKASCHAWRPLTGLIVTTIRRGVLRGLPDAVARVWCPTWLLGFVLVILNSPLKQLHVTCETRHLWYQLPLVERDR